eukprot:1182361-Prorocentrum_minimum.AAC.4
MALREHVLDGGCFVRGVDLEGLAIPQPAWFVGVDRERPPPRFHRVAGDVVAVTVHLLPELGVVGHVSRVSLPVDVRAAAVELSVNHLVAGVASREKLSLVSIIRKVLPLMS